MRILSSRQHHRQGRRTDRQRRTEFIGLGRAVFLLMTAGVAPASRSPARRSCCSPASASPTANLTLFGVVAGGAARQPGRLLDRLRGRLLRPLDLLEKNKLIHISPEHLKWADDWFERYGDATVFFSRMLPIIRTFISLPAGVAKMPFWRFTWLTALGSIPWVLGWR